MAACPNKASQCLIQAGSDDGGSPGPRASQRGYAAPGEQDRQRQVQQPTTKKSPETAHHLELSLLELVSWQNLFAQPSSRIVHVCDKSFTLVNLLQLLLTLRSLEQNCRECVRDCLRWKGLGSTPKFLPVHRKMRRYDEGRAGQSRELEHRVAGSQSMAT